MFGTLDNPTKIFKRLDWKNFVRKLQMENMVDVYKKKEQKRYFVGAREIYDDKIHYDTAPEININEFEKDYKKMQC